MNFLEAVKAMQDGFCVTRPNRKADFTTYKLSKKLTEDTTRCIDHYHNGVNIDSYALLHDSDFLADDWEVLEEKP